ncbi:MAG: four helix bundle protein [Planctomycetia bacterium]|nr:four helix bundle protein [Planctomycetia bacterium]
MTKEELKLRTKQFGLRVMKLVDALPKSASGRAIANQLIRSGTAIGANYRAACRARSRREFLSRLGVVEEEADESTYWLEHIVDSGLVKPRRVGALLQEANELTRIFAAAIKTTRNGSKKASET